MVWRGLEGCCSEPGGAAANAFAANGSPVYLYRFSHVSTALREKLRAGAPHGGEISYVFGTLIAGPGSTLPPEDQAVSRMAQSYWVNFARTGDPNGPGLPAWPRHDPKKDVIFDFRLVESSRTSFSHAGVRSVPPVTAAVVSHGAARVTGRTVFFGTASRHAAALSTPGSRSGRGN